MTQEYIFVEYNHIQGKNKDTNEPYEFANVTLSDGLVSVEYPVKLTLLHVLDSLKRAQKVLVEKEEKARGRLFNITVVDIHAAE